MNINDYTLLNIKFLTMAYMPSLCLPHQASNSYPLALCIYTTPINGATFLITSHFWYFLY